MPETSPRPVSTMDTVDWETPAAAATSACRERPAAVTEVVVALTLSASSATSRSLIYTNRLAALDYAPLAVFPQRYELPCSTGAPMMFCGHPKIAEISNLRRRRRARNDMADRSSRIPDHCRSGRRSGCRLAAADRVWQVQEHRYGGGQ